MKKLAVTISIIIAIVTTFQLSWAYDGSVHKKINESAVEASQLESVLKNQLGIENGTDAIFKKGRETKSVLKWIAYGGEAEDYGWFGKYDYPSTRGFNHFHNEFRDVVDYVE